MFFTNNKKTFMYGGLILYTLVVMLFCTKSSPLYIFNDWFDANAYFTMGKGMMNGAVPYRDLFDHKGPLLYFIYGLGYLIDHTGFLGVFIFQVISMSLVVIFSYKTARIYTDTDRSAMIIAVLVPVFSLSTGIYTSGGDYGGGGPEDFILAIFAMCLYALIKLAGYTPTDTKPVKRSMFLIGLLTGFIFLLKFTCIVFSIGLILPFLIDSLIKNKRIFLISLLFLFLGFAASTFPYFVYVKITHSGSSFIEAYIKFNVLYGMASSGSARVLAVGLSNAISFLFSNSMIGIIMILGIIYFVFIEKTRVVANLSVLLSFVFVIIISSVVTDGYTYIPVTIYCVFGYIAIYKTCLQSSENILRLKNENQKLTNIIAVVLIIMVTIGNNALCANPLDRLNQKEPVEPCQQKAADIILADSEENRTLLEANCLDSGFYTACGIVPSSKYFYTPSIGYSVYPQVLDGQLADIQSSLNTYVITSDQLEYDQNAENQPVSGDNIIKKIGNAILMNYKLIEVIPGTYLQSDRTYYLYKAIDSI